MTARRQTLAEWFAELWAEQPGGRRHAIITSGLLPEFDAQGYPCIIEKNSWPGDPKPGTDECLLRQIEMEHRPEWNGKTLYMHPRTAERAGLGGGEEP